MQLLSKHNYIYFLSIHSLFPFVHNSYPLSSFWKGKAVPANVKKDIQESSTSGGIRLSNQVRIPVKIWNWTILYSIVSTIVITVLLKGLNYKDQNLIPHDTRFDFFTVLNILIRFFFGGGDDDYFKDHWVLL